MNDSKLVQGLVLAACIFLLVGILATWMELGKYRDGATRKGGVPSPTTVQEEPPPPADTGMDEAPADTPAAAPEPAPE
jgi:hypothetical protein